MLYGSNFILNACQKRLEYEIYPFIHNYNDVQNESEIQKSIRIPDKVASEVVTEDADFSMVAGEFTNIYGSEMEVYDGVVTCFFLDTANNIFTYIDTINAMLKVGGLWINYGPLLYHYKDILNEISI